MKIVNISHVYFPAERVPLDWINKSRFFKGAWEKLAETQEVIFAEFINFTGSITHYGIEYWFTPKSKQALRFPLKTHLAIAKALPDVVIVHGTMFPVQVILLRLLLKSNCKIVVQHHGERLTQHPLKRFLLKLSDRFINTYFFTAAAQADPWIASGIISHGNKVVEVMETSSVFKPISEHEAKAVTKINTGNNYIWIGHLNENKNPLLVVKAFTRFVADGNDRHLYMVYQSEKLLPEIIQWFKDHPGLENHIHLIGKIEHTDLVFWFCSVDFIISSSYSEGSGVAVCEGMSCGCIPILTSIPSFRYMTGNACGILYDAGDHQSLVEALFASSKMDVTVEKVKTLRQFQQSLSFDAIARRLQQVLVQISKQD